MGFLGWIPGIHDIPHLEEGLETAILAGAIGAATLASGGVAAVAAGVLAGAAASDVAASAVTLADEKATKKEKVEAGIGLALDVVTLGLGGAVGSAAVSTAGEVAEEVVQVARVGEESAAAAEEAIEMSALAHPEAAEEVARASEIGVDLGPELGAAEDMALVEEADAEAQQYHMESEEHIPLLNEQRSILEEESRSILERAGVHAEQKFQELVKKVGAAVATKAIVEVGGDLFQEPSSERHFAPIGPAPPAPGANGNGGDEGPGHMGGDSHDTSGGSLDIFGPVRGFVSNITKTIISALNFDSRAPVQDSDLPDAIIFDVMKRNDSQLHQRRFLFAHDRRFTDVLYVRGTSNMAEWRGNVSQSNQQQLLRQQTEQVLQYVEKYPQIRHIIGHSRGAAIAHDAAHISKRMFCGIDGAMVIARGPGALKARNINKTGGFDRMLDPIGPIEKTADGTEKNLSEKIHHAELGVYTAEYQDLVVNIPVDQVATGYERGDKVRKVPSRNALLPLHRKKRKINMNRFRERAKQRSLNLRQTNRFKK